MLTFSMYSIKKILQALLIGALLSALNIQSPAFANELDDQRVADLFAAATKVRSYGDYCWEVVFAGEWELPQQSLEPSEFRIYAMDVSVLRRPGGDYNYATFRKQFARSTKKSFKPKDRALIVCLPVDFSFDKYKEEIFKPWVIQSAAGTSQNWLFVRHKGKIYAKSKWETNHAWFTGVKAIQDFVCVGVDDPNIIKIEGNAITFKSRSVVCFRPGDRVSKTDPFAGQWQDESGASMLDRRLEANKVYTLTFTGNASMPKGWN